MKVIYTYPYLENLSEIMGHIENVHFHNMKMEYRGSFTVE